MTVHLITGSDQDSMEKQVENLGQVQDSFAGTSTPFTWEIDASPTSTPAASPPTTAGRSPSTGAWISSSGSSSPFNAAAVMQEARMMKGL